MNHIHTGRTRIHANGVVTAVCAKVFRICVSIENWKKDFNESQALYILHSSHVKREVIVNDTTERQFESIFYLNFPLHE